MYQYAQGLGYSVSHVVEMLLDGSGQMSYTMTNLNGRALCGAPSPVTNGWASLTTQRLPGALHCKPCDDAWLAMLDVAAVRSAVGNVRWEDSYVVSGLPPVAMNKADRKYADTVTHLFDRLTLALSSLESIATSDRGARHAREIAEAAIKIDADIARGPADLTTGEIVSMEARTRG